MATTYAYGDAKLNENIQSLGLAKTLTASDSGKTFTLNAATGKAIVLPPVAIAGFKVRFQTGTLFATTAWTFTAPTAVIQGGAIVNSVFVPCASKAIVTFSATADTLGDWIEIVSDGALYYINGVGAQAASIAFT
jgi:hypothetical protein